MKPSEWDAAWAADCEPGCVICDEPMEHTDRQALQAEQDADSAAIDAQIEGHA